MFAFMTQSYFKVPKEAILSSTHYFVMKFPKKDSFNKSHLIIHQILSLKILWRFIKNIYQYSFLVNDMTLPSDNPLRFRKDPLEKMF